MKNLFTILLSMLLLGVGYKAQAAFPLKQATSSAAVPPANQSATAVETASAYHTSTTTKTNRTADTIPQALYIVMAIFLLGWLAMGINDNFEEYDWLISLLLYIIMYLPGLIFTLIKMSKYY